MSNRPTEMQIFGGGTVSVITEVQPLFPKTLLIDINTLYCCWCIAERGSNPGPRTRSKEEGGRDEDDLVPTGPQGERACSWDEG